jgi:succinate dehydrogenase / fumarate reductase, iron-sulfur subunit
MSQSDAQQVTVRIRRQETAEKPSRWEEFSVPVRPNMNIISVLQYIAAYPKTTEGVPTTPPVWDAGSKKCAAPARW